MIANLDSQSDRVPGHDSALSDQPLLDCSVAEAQARIDARVTRLSEETLPVLLTGGRRLARPAIAVTSVPGFRRAAMDGFAVRFDDVRRISAQGIISLTIVAESLPGRPFLGDIGPGQCAAISTGARVPTGTDTVIRWEVLEREANRIVVSKPVEAYRDIALPDEDIPLGSVIVAPPRTLRPQDVAACCSAGLREVDVIRQPRVGILSTGDELVPANALRALGQIVDTNSIVLQHLIERDGGQVVIPSGERGPLLADDFSVIKSAVVSLAAQVDCLLISGSTSRGQGDHAVDVLVELGTVEFRGVRIRPAAPTTFGMIQGIPVCLLPGNPVACLFGYDLLARRVIRLLGDRNLTWPYPCCTKVLTRPICSERGRVDYVRVRCLDDETVDPVWPRGASVLTSTVAADGFIIVPESIDKIEIGELVTVHLYDDPDS